MSESKHTPGPWIAEGPDDFGDFNIEPDPDALCVAAAVSNLRPAVEVAANARLIAAAPEMLEALRMVVSYLTTRDPNRGALLTPALNAAQAALARAEGRS